MVSMPGVSWCLHCHAQTEQQVILRITVPEAAVRPCPAHRGRARACHEMVVLRDFYSSSSLACGYMLPSED